MIEPLHGYLSLIENSFFNKKLEGAWNFGPKDEQFRSVSEVISTIQKKGLDFDYENLCTNSIESKILSLNSTKAKQLLKWESILDFSKTIEKTISWYSDFYDGSKALDLCINDIKYFKII